MRHTYSKKKKLFVYLEFKFNEGFYILPSNYITEVENH